MAANYLQRVAAAASRTTSMAKPVRAAQPLTERMTTPLNTGPEPRAEAMADAGSVPEISYSPSLLPITPPVGTEPAGSISHHAEKLQDAEPPLEKPAATPALPPSFPPSAGLSMFAKSATHIKAPPGLRPTRAEAKLPVTPPPQVKSSDLQSPLRSQPAPGTAQPTIAVPSSLVSAKETDSFSIDSAKSVEVKIFERAELNSKPSAPSTVVGEKINGRVITEAMPLSSAKSAIVPSPTSQAKQERRINIGQIDVHVNNQNPQRKSMERPVAAGRGYSGRFDAQDTGRFFLKP